MTIPILQMRKPRLREVMCMCMALAHWEAREVQEASMTLQVPTGGVGPRVGPRATLPSLGFPTSSLPRKQKQRGVWEKQASTDERKGQAVAPLPLLATA